MLRAYVDESEDGDVLVLSGGVAAPAAWAAASNDWDAALKFGVKLNWFKFAEATSLSGEFSFISEQSRDEKVGHLRGVIYDHKIPQVSAFLPLRAFDHVFGHPFVPKDFRNPYVWLLYALVVHLAQVQKQGRVLLPNEPIDFFFDRRDIERDKIWKAWEAFKNIAWAKSLIGQEPQFLDDKKTPPLQMADLAAGLARNYWRESFLGEKFKWNFPDYRHADVPYVTFTWTEERLRARLNEIISAYNKPLMSFTFDRWTYLKEPKEQ
jgi:hypothetical protein